MKLGGRERMDDGAALEELFAHLPVTADWTVGFLTAVCTGPDAIAPAVWIPEIVPDGAFDEDPTARAKVDTAGAPLRRGRRDATNDARDHLPRGRQARLGGRRLLPGYVRGARLHETWRNDEAATKKLLPFAALAKETVDAVDADGNAVTDVEAWTTAQREHLGGHVAGLHAYWQSKRQVVHTTPKVGRNDPCPCGSGKKHKKCCLAKQG